MPEVQNASASERHLRDPEVQTQQMHAMQQTHVMHAMQDACCMRVYGLTDGCVRAWHCTVLQIGTDVWCRCGNEFCISYLMEV